MKFLRILFFITTASALLTGVDISFIEMFESFGGIYRDETGEPKDLFQIIKDSSIDVIRLRLFTSTEEQANKDMYDYGNTLNRTLRLARRIKAHGLQFMLDFHYSDSWAGPDFQVKPSAWANLTFEQLINTLYNYTRDSLRAFIEQDTIPQYIQIGNEISSGMLWPDGYIGTDNNWPQFLTLLNTTSNAVRTVLNNQTKMIVHVTYSTNWPGAKRFFDHVVGTVDFDIIGLSYYTQWFGNLTELRYCLGQIATNYDKPIFIVETNYRWQHDPSVNDSMKNKTGFDETPQGQMEYAQYLGHLLYNTTDKTKETGLFWWCTEFVPTEGHTNFTDHQLRSFFNTSSIALPIVKHFGKSDHSQFDEDGLASGPSKTVDEFP